MVRADEVLKDFGVIRRSDFPLFQLGDLFGGLTTAVISLPLALAFGVASGAGAQAGLYGAVFVGLLQHSLEEPEL